MSRTYVDYNKLRSILLGSLGECEADKLSFNNDYKVFEETPALRVACRMVRALASNIIQFDKLLRNGRYSLNGLKYRAVIIPGPEPETVRVFPGITLNAWESETELKVCSPYLFGTDILRDMAATIMSDLADPRKAKAWETTKRCINRMKRSEVMPVARALTRYTNLYDDKILRDNQIRDLADAIVDVRKPMELIYADEPHQFKDMYNSGPESCMANLNGGRTFTFLVNDHDSHPTAFFAFHPYTRGVYAKKRNSAGEMAVVARCIIYQKSNGNWYYGRIYTSGSGSIADKFRQNLEAAGIEELDGTFERNVTFTIPGYQIGKKASKSNDYDDAPARGIGDFACPTPYFDNLRGQIKATWNKDTQDFTIQIAQSGLDANVNTGNTAGYITASQITVCNCAQCGTRIRPGGTQYHNQANGDIYCSSTCVRRSGNLMMYRSDGQQVIRPRDVDTVEDVLNNGSYYTNMAAAERLGVVPASSSALIWDEEPGVSRSGYQLLDHHTQESFQVSHNSLIRLRDAGLVNGVNYQLNVRRDVLRTMTINVQRVSAMTASTDEPLFVDANQMVVPAGFNDYQPITSLYAVSADTGTDAWGYPDDFAEFFTQLQTGQARAA